MCGKIVDQPNEWPDEAAQPLNQLSLWFDEG